MPYCQDCGAWVSRNWIRVFGIDGNVDACRNCATIEELSKRTKTATDAAITDWREE